MAWCGSISADRNAVARYWIGRKSCRASTHAQGGPNVLEAKKLPEVVPTNVGWTTTTHKTDTSAKTVDVGDTQNDIPDVPTIPEPHKPCSVTSWEPDENRFRTKLGNFLFQRSRADPQLADITAYTWNIPQGALERTYVPDDATVTVERSGGWGKRPTIRIAVSFKVHARSNCGDEVEVPFMYVIGGVWRGQVNSPPYETPMIPYIEVPLIVDIPALLPAGTEEAEPPLPEPREPIFEITLAPDATGTPGVVLTPPKDRTTSVTVVLVDDPNPDIIGTRMSSQGVSGEVVTKNKFDAWVRLHFGNNAVAKFTNSFGAGLVGTWEDYNKGYSMWGSWQTYTITY